MAPAATSRAEPENTSARVVSLPLSTGSTGATAGADFGGSGVGGRHGQRGARREGQGADGAGQRDASVDEHEDLLVRPVAAGLSRDPRGVGVRIGCDVEATPAPPPLKAGNPHALPYSAGSFRASSVRERTPSLR